VRRIDIILKIDGTVVVGIISIDHFNGNGIDIITIPSSITSWNIEWTVTIDMTIVWTVFISPSVFTIDNTSVDFTRINGSVIVIITIFG